MFKKLTTLFLASFTFLWAAQAQDFELRNGKIMYDTTAGVTPYNGEPEGHEAVQVANYIRNISSQPFVAKWRNLSTDTTQNPTGWVLTGICDNIMCRGEYDPAWYFGGEQETFAIDPGQTSLLEVRVYVPTTSPDATGIYEVEIKTPNQIDTAVFVITKDSRTGISAISLTDPQVSLYPNPLSYGATLNLYVNKRLNGEKAMIYNIIGQQKMEVPLSKELTSLNVSGLAHGIYLVKIINQSGKVITSRKFTKK